MRGCGHPWETQTPGSPSGLLSRERGLRCPRRGVSVRGGNGLPLPLSKSGFGRLAGPQRAGTVVKAASAAQSCPPLCDLMDDNLPGSSVHGVLQARTLEWVAISFSRGSSQLRNRTQGTYVSGIAKWVLSHWALWEDGSHGGDKGTASQWWSPHTVTDHPSFPGCTWRALHLRGGVSLFFSVRH